jgi:drug/metabolite transporter (DMT)-like permease
MKNSTAGKSKAGTSKTGVYLSATGAMVMWSMTFVWFKIANEVYPPFTIVFLRLLVSSLVMVAIAGFTSVLQKLQRRDLPRFILLAAIYPFVYFIAESIGLTKISASLAAVIISTIPLVVPIGAYFLLHERVSVLNIVGILISFMGVLIVILNLDFSFNAEPSGMLLMLLAVFCAVGYTLMVKKLTERYNAYSITTYQNIMGTLMFLPLFLVFDLQDFATASHTAKAILNLGYLAIFGSSIAFILFNYSVKTIGATRTETFSNLIPVLTAVFAWFMLGEELGLKKIIGIGVVLAGLFLSQLKSRKRPYEHLAAP